MPEIDVWQITGGDILTLLGLLGAWVVFVSRVVGRINVQQETLRGLEKRLDQLTAGDRKDERESGADARSVDARLDRKRDK